MSACLDRQLWPRSKPRANLPDGKVPRIEMVEHQTDECSDEEDRPHKDGYPLGRTHRIAQHVGEDNSILGECLRGL